MHCENCLNLSVSHVLFAYSTFKQQKVTQSASETGTFTFQGAKNTQFQMHEKLKSVFSCAN